jgi:hypothetical protein
MFIREMAQIGVQAITRFPITQKSTFPPRVVTNKMQWGNLSPDSRIPPDYNSSHVARLQALCLESHSFESSHSPPNYVGIIFISFIQHIKTLFHENIWVMQPARKHGGFYISANFKTSSFLAGPDTL